MRRISTGVQGRPILGNFFTETNTFSTRETNQDIVLEPNGAGLISAESHFRIDGDHALIFRDSGNNNTITIESPAISSDYTLTLPSDIGSNGNALIVDGSGNLSFSNISVDVNNQTADTQTYYPVITTSTSGGLNSVSVSSSKLSFQPSSGTLTVDTLSTNDVDIGGGSIDGTTIGANTAAAGTFTSITETSSEILKDNIQTLGKSLSKILNLEAVSYVRKSTGEKEVGLIAEEVEKTIPELVYTDGKYKSISYSRLTAYLIESIKDLNTEIERLKI